VQRNIATRLDAQGRPTPLIAETGGLNAMIVDSSALTEQVVVDVLASAFDSAGQRCSALRVLCLQEEIAEHTSPCCAARWRNVAWAIRDA
jgi:RHH-type proline utilization regulon transcriptional repressor/proline dehydrogenase/delta 1-pyrroline-5-carboxylate dehydrogenase